MSIHSTKNLDAEQYAGLSRDELVARVHELEQFVTNITEHGYYDHPLIEGDEAVALKETLTLLERDARALMLMPRPTYPTAK